MKIKNQLKATSYLTIMILFIMKQLISKILAKLVNLLIYYHALKILKEILVNLINLKYLMKKKNSCVLTYKN